MQSITKADLQNYVSYRLKEKHHNKPIQPDIENRSHYVRDVTFGEDACQISKGDAPQIMAAFRNAIVSMLRLEGHANIAAALRACTWKSQRMLTMLGIVKK